MKMFLDLGVSSKRSSSGKWSSTAKSDLVDLVIKWFGWRSQKFVIQVDSAVNFLTQTFESLVNKSKGNKADSKNGTDGAIVGDGDTVHPNVLEVCKCSCSVDLEGLKQEITILESRLFAAISKNELELDIDLLRVKQKESEAAIRRQDDVICTLNEENQFLKARLLALEKSFLKITYNVDTDKEPGSSVYKAKGIDKAAAFHASEQSNKSNLSSINTELLNTSHDNSLARHNNNGQRNADDLKNNQIDLANDDAVFSPKQQNENNTHKGINSNLQSESQQSTNIEGNKPRYDLSPKTSHDNSRIRYDPSLKTSHDNSLIWHNDNSQCNADDLKNNHIDHDAVFFPKQQNKNNKHKGLNSNLQSESQQSINSERENPEYNPSLKTSVPCPFLIRCGRCFKGDRCDFKHPKPSETRKCIIPCPFLHKRWYCLKKKMCDFSHDKLGDT
ncbi:---NA--- [Paramuricea clavata]|uniref:---NA n=1 Tax=Paramuricea clavata TaxID=317549 RepID=A0A6S7HRY7_PARCT|nr:---NA--- [Paramuricea clavata]